MDKVIELIIPIAASAAVALLVRYPATWRVELAKIQYSMLKDLSRTDNWGNPSLYYGRGAVKSKGYHRSVTVYLTLAYLW